MATKNQKVKKDRGHRSNRWKSLSTADKVYVRGYETKDPFAVVWFESMCIWNGRQCNWAVVSPTGEVWKQGGGTGVGRPPRVLTDYARDMNIAYKMGQGIETSKYVLKTGDGEVVESAGMVFG